MSVWTFAGDPVFWLLAAMGVAAATLFLVRLLGLRRAHIDYVDFIHGVGNLLSSGREDEALVLCEETDVPVARAVAPVGVLAEYLLPFLKTGGYMLAMKGPNLEEELRAGAGAIEMLGGRLERCVALPIPGRDWDHRAAWIVKASPTPQRYPRRAGMPEKRPLT